MSILHEITVACPACHKQVPCSSYASVHVQRVPEARERLLDETFNLKECIHCAEHFRVRATLHYFDVERRIAILISDSSEVDVVALRQEFRKAFSHESFAEDLTSMFRIRVVPNMAAAREAIMVCERGFDMDAVQRAKDALLAKHHAQPSRVELKLLKIGDDGILYYAGKSDDPAVEIPAIYKVEVRLTGSG